MTDSRPTRQFETQLEIAAPRDAVWDALTRDAELRRWFAPRASVDPRVGGEVVWEWAGHHRWPQRIEVLEPGARLRTRYDSQVDGAGGGKQPLWIDFLLEGRGGATTLRVVQSGFGPEADFDQEYDGISRGWPVELRSLRLYLEQHRGRDRRLAWSSRDLTLDPAVAWARLTGPEGLRCGAAVEALREGEPFSFETADGDRFEGTALRCDRHEFSGDARSHGGAFLRLSVERWGGMAHVWCWLGAYECGPDETAALQQRWDAMLDRLFAANGDARPAGAAR